MLSDLEYSHLLFDPIYFLMVDHSNLLEIEMEQLPMFYSQFHISFLGLLKSSS